MRAFQHRGGFLSGAAPATELAAGATGSDLTLSGALGVTGATTLTGDIAAGNLNMTSGKVLTLATGSVSAVAMKFSGHAAGTGWHGTTVDQIDQARAGTNHLRITAGGVTPLTALVAASNLTVAGTTTATGGIVANAGLTANSSLALAPESTKTADYTAANEDTVVAMNDGGGAALNFTLPPSPGSGDTQWVKNLGTSALAVLRNGNTIDTVAADGSIAAGASQLYIYNGSTWLKL